MDTNQVLQIILIVSISISILLLTVYLVRVLNSVKKLIDETTKIVEDTAAVSGAISDTVQSVKNKFDRGSIFSGLFGVAKNFGLLSSVKDWFLSKNKKENKSKEKKSETKS